MKDDDCEAHAQEQLASLKRDMRKTMEDATVRAVHKVMAEFEAKSDERLMEDWGPGPHECHSLPVREPEQPAQPQKKLRTCNCRWDGDMRVQQCTLHEAHIAAIHKWAERAKDAEHEFKNFHRLLCERFGYAHDERDWKRDQLSLIEWIAKPAQQEPVAWRIRCTEPLREWTLLYRYPKIEEQFSNMEIEPLYTTPPPQRKPLTDGEIEEIAAITLFPIEFARAIEAAHSIKENT